MHVILATMGTDGDVFPYVGLGAALRERDQPDNAARVVKLGAGMVLGRRHQGSADMARALGRLTGGEFGERCRGIAVRAGGGDGLGHAAEWVEQLGL